MSRVVFLLEERSMATFLYEFLPRAVPGTAFVCISHEGKQDLEQSLQLKLRAWREPGARFVVVCDQDLEDCVALKARLSDLCRRGAKTAALVRIACRQLEAWYLGDPGALAEEFGVVAVAGIGRRRQFRNPDVVHDPASKLRRMISGFQKVDGARRMGRRIGISGGSSPSFNCFVSGVARIASGMPKAPTGDEEA